MDDSFALIISWVVRVNGFFFMLSINVPGAGQSVQYPSPSKVDFGLLEALKLGFFNL